VFAVKRNDQVLQPLALNIALASQLLGKKSVVPLEPLEPRHERLSVYEVLSNVLVLQPLELNSVAELLLQVLSNVLVLQPLELNSVAELLLQELSNVQASERPDPRHDLAKQSVVVNNDWALLPQVLNSVQEFERLEDSSD
jgi:hypothetical protein